MTGITSLLVGFSDQKITEAASSVQAIGIVVAVWVGGWFTLFKLNVFRNFRPQLNISLDILDRVFDSSSIHISVVANLRNTSRVHVEPNEIKFLLSHVVPATHSDPSPGIYDWSGKELVIEPGETHIEVHSFCVDFDVRTVKVHVVAKSGSKDGLKWDTIKFYDITTKPEGE